MTSSPTYGHRIPAALETLRQSSGDWVDLRKLQELLSVSKTFAWRVLRHRDASPGPGNTLICGRTALIAWLEALQRDDGPPGRKSRSHDRLVSILERIRPHILANLTEVAQDSRALGMIGRQF
jgi:hypothetical protein